MRLASSYCSAEEAVVSAFFKQPRKRRDHSRWLKAQGFKEYSAIQPIIAALSALYDTIDRGLPRHAYVELTEKLADETKHARLVMDLLEEVTGKKITPRDLKWLPQDRKLAAVRARYSKTVAKLLHGSGRIRSHELNRNNERLERAALTLTEGGGGALYRVCSTLRNPGIERKIARVFTEILADEMGHKDAGARFLARLVRNERSFRRAATIVAEVCGQRLRMRNEQFGFPLAPAELTALESRVKRSADLK